MMVRKLLSAIKLNKRTAFGFFFIFLDTGSETTPEFQVFQVTVSPVWFIFTPCVTFRSKKPVLNTCKLLLQLGRVVVVSHVACRCVQI